MSVRMTVTAIQNSSAVSRVQYGVVEYAIGIDIRENLSDQAQRKIVLKAVDMVFHPSDAVVVICGRTVIGTSVG